MAKVRVLRPGDDPFQAIRIGGLVFAVLAILWSLNTTFFQVESDEVGVVLRFGKYHRTTEPGLHFKIPLVNNVRKYPKRVLNYEHSEEKFLTGEKKNLIVDYFVTWRIVDPETTAEMLNFNLKKGANTYVSEDPLKLGDRVVRTVQSALQSQVASATLRQALALNRQQVGAVRQLLAGEKALPTLGIDVMNVAIAAITPTTETARALEAEAREAILQIADDAIYARRKSAVEQERVEAFVLNPREGRLDGSRCGTEQGCV